MLLPTGVAETDYITDFKTWLNWFIKDIIYDCSCLGLQRPGANDPGARLGCGPIRLCFVVLLLVRGRAVEAVNPAQVCCLGGFRTSHKGCCLLLSLELCCSHGTPLPRCLGLGCRRWGPRGSQRSIGGCRAFSGQAYSLYRPGESQVRIKWRHILLF